METTSCCGDHSSSPQSKPIIFYTFCFNSEFVLAEFSTDARKQILNSKYIEWLQIDQNLLSYLFVTISESVLPYVLHLKHAHEV